MNGYNRIAIRMKIPDTEGEYGKVNEELDVDLDLGIEVIRLLMVSVLN
ncbi:hypothetical protein IQ255_30645 [Pleurocapsales cyanobacterium LEGE 10410]|nr:hypothetical protein [Pleurocapsales cyanobacterium LEGE 10410]